MRRLGSSLIEAGAGRSGGVTLHGPCRAMRPMMRIFVHSCLAWLPSIDSNLSNFRMIQMINWRMNFRFSCLTFLLLSAAAHAQVTVPVGAAVQLNGGSIDLGGNDLVVGGSLSIGAGAIDAGHGIAIAASGVIDAGTGSLSVSGDWSNAGVFVPGSSLVTFEDGVEALSNYSGNTRFHDAAFVSAAGKTHAFAVGSTQEFDGLLRILGTAALPIQITSSAAGQVAFFNLLPGGTQDIHFVGVSDVHAIGQPLAPDETNQGGAGNDVGWFGNTPLVEAAQIPTLSSFGALLLALALVALVARRRSQFLD